MNFIRKWFRRIWYLVWYLFAALVVFLAAVFGLARLLLPMIDDYNQDIEHYAARLIDRPVKIMSLDAEWHGFSPSLVLNNVRLLSKDGSQTLLDLSRARLDFDLLGIIKTRTVQFKKFALSGANLSIVRQKTGEINLAGFDAKRIEVPAQQERGLMMRWLLAQGEIDLHASNLIYQDRKTGDARYHLTNVSLTLRNGDGRHLIDGAIRFPRHEDQEFSFSLDITGDITQGRRWAASMYFAGANVDARRVLGALGIRDYKISVGQSNFEIWSDWQNASLVSLQGDVSLENVALKTGNQYTPLLQPLLAGIDEHAPQVAVKGGGRTHTVSYDSVIGRFQWDKDVNGWRLKADQFVLARNKRVWPASQLSMRYVRADNNAPRFDVRASLLRIEDLTPLLPVLVGDNQRYTEFIKKLSPQGELRNVNAQWTGEGNRYAIAGRVEQVAFRPVGKVPGFKGLTGEVRLDNDQGSVVFDTGDGEFSYPRMFRWDIPVKRLQGLVRWRNGEDSLQLSSRDIVLDTAHLKSEAVLDLEIPRDKKPPFISLITKFHDGDGSKASYYFPVSIMKEKTVKWLDTAIVQGHVTSGGAIIYGPLDRFPFTKGQGVFDVRFSAENAILDYAEDWPQIHDARTQVVFRGNSLSVTSNQAQIFSNTLTKVRVAIDDLREKPLQLSIAGRVSGKSQEKLNYMIVSPPLYRKYGQFLRNLKAAGNSDLDLNIGLDIADEVQATVKGDLHLTDNSLEMRSIPDMLSGLTGDLKISNKGLNARRIQAHLLGQPGTLKVKTVSAGATADTRDIVVTATGKFDARTLSEQRFPVMKDLVDGRANWQVALTVPGGGGEQESRNLQLAVTTKLKGVTSNLPPPFTKQKNDVRDLNILMDIKDVQRILFKVSYAGQFAGIFDCDTSDPLWVTRGDIRFGGGPVVLPGTEGLRITGTMKELSVDIWKSLIEQAINSFKSSNSVPVSNAQPKDTKPLYMALINSVDLLIKKFEIFGQQAQDLRLKIKNKGQWLDANVDSKELKGSIVVPQDLQNKSLELDMQRLQLQSVENRGGKFDPRDLPSIAFNSRSLMYDNKKLGAVAFNAKKTDKGLLLEQITVRPRATTVKGVGRWQVEQGQQNSRFEFVLDSDDLGKTMQDLGYVDTIEGGGGKITAKLHWPGALIDPDLHHISGNVELNFTNGRILDIEPGGAARLFGLFSLQTLPRRLTLDFSDLFGKGLGFDSVHGQFKIEDGDAYTNNFTMTGPSADVSLRGRIGIGSRDYDQRIRVTPHITDTTILLSIITSQPLLFFFQQLLKEDFDKAASFEYSLTGSWDNYKLEPILKQPPAAPENDGF
ncbi:MAG: YhdP family protein [Gammaproteobacteria bacterium]|jgi:uncharacterized protein (TIGR02099 family)